MIGTTGLLLWIAGGFLYSVLIARRAVEEAEAEPVALLEAACERLGVRKTVAIVRSETVKVPVVVGLLHPKIILPTQALTWPRERLGAIFLHEAAHIRRLDLLVQFLARCTCALFWFNPLLWVIERKLFLAGECACDDAVIRHDVAATAYADYLMDTSVDLGTDRNPVWATAAMAEGTAFKDRILSILNPNLHREPPKSAHRTTVIFATGLILLPLIALSPWRLPSVPLPPADRPLQTEVGAGQQPEPDRGRPIYEPADPQDPGDRVSELIRLLRSSEADVREHAATALGELRDERAVGSLIALLDDPDAKVREHVATALGLLGDGRAFDPLLEAMRRDADARVREHAAPALGRLGDPRAFDPLLAVMRGGDVEPVRAHAAWGLGLLGDRRALPILIEALESGSESMRANAAMGLGELGDRGALDALARAERDRSRLVREQAALARQKIRSRGR